MNIMTFGTKIRKKRIERGFSQENLADLINVSQSTLSNIESDKSIPDLNFLLKASEVLDVSINDLVDHDKIVLNNNQQGGIGYAEVVNQLSDKLIEQYDEKFNELKAVIIELKTQLTHLGKKG